MRDAAIDVIIPCLNMRHFIDDAIASVLNQDYPKARLTIVDNGSSDGTVQELRTAGVRVLVQERPGAGAARMLGVDHTDAPLIFFLDADDVLTPQALSTLALALTQGTSLLAFGEIENQYVDASGTPTKTGRRALAPLASNSLLDRRAFETFGPLDDDNYAWPRWVVAARDRGMATASVAQLIAHRRVHGGNVSLRDGMSSALLRLAREHHTSTGQL
jgi:glycosyltransferase involved in cell wall biosynthesis